MNEALWSAVQRALDDRRDPLSDPAVEAELAQHPQDLGALLDLLAELETLRSAPAPRAWPRMPLAAAAGLLLALGLGWGAHRRAPSPAPQPPEAQLSEARLSEARLSEARLSEARPGFIRSWQVTITHQSPTVSTRVVCRDGIVLSEGLSASMEGATVARLTTYPAAFPSTLPVPKH